MITFFCGPQIIIVVKFRYSLYKTISCKVAFYNFENLFIYWLFIAKAQISLSVPFCRIILHKPVDTVHNYNF